MQKRGGAVKKNKKKIKTDKYSTIIKPNLEVIEKMARDNFTDEEIAKHFNIAKSSFSRYKKDNVALRKALAKGKEQCIAEVENIYFKSALGFDYKEEKLIYDIEKKLIKKEVYKKKSLPNANILRDILRNKGDWENKEVGDTSNIVLQLKKGEGDGEYSITD